MNGRICFSILMTRKYLKLEIEIQVSSITESSGKKNKFVRLFFGRNYGSTILFRDLLTIKRRISIKLDINWIISRVLVFSDSLIREVGHVDKELIMNNFFRYFFLWWVTYLLRSKKSDGLGILLEFFNNSDSKNSWFCQIS